MIVKFFKHGKSQTRPTKSAKQAVNYITGAEVWSKAENRLEARSVAPVTIRGDVDTWSEIVGHGNHAGRYTSGVLRFAEKDIDEGKQQAIIDDFEKALLPGLEPDQYSALWVRHEDKGSVELHFMVAGEELRTGKRLNAYYHRADKPRIDSWKNAINAEYDFADPNDPNRRRSITTAKDLPKEKQEIVNVINDHITNLVIDGEIINRSGVLNELEKLQLEVCRETKTSISIKDPGNGQNIRLKGAVYERAFKSSDYSAEGIQTRAGEYGENRGERAREARSLFNKMCEKRSAVNRDKYKKSIVDADLYTDISTNNTISHGYDSGNSRNILPPKQSISYSFGGQPELYFMSGNRGKQRRPETVQTTIKKEKEHESNGERNKRIYEEFWERVRSKREAMEQQVQRVIGAFRGIGKGASQFTEIISRGIEQQQRNNATIREDQERESGIKQPIDSIRESIEKLERENRLKNNRSRGFSPR